MAMSMFMCGSASRRVRPRRWSVGMCAALQVEVELLLRLDLMSSAESRAHAREVVGRMHAFLQELHATAGSVKQEPQVRNPKPSPKPKHADRFRSRLAHMLGREKIR